jgi:hypothetical protein
MSADFAKMKSLFFDAKEIVEKLDPETRKALSRFGAFVRRRAKSSLRYGTGTSSAGQPPIVHRTQTRSKVNKKGVVKVQVVSPLRELLFFKYDPASRSVVIGPELGGSKTGAPQALEEGGTAVIDGTRTAVRARPFMRPAFAAEMGNVMGNFRNILRG